MQTIMTGIEYLKSIREKWRELQSLTTEQAEFLARAYSISSPAFDSEKVMGGEQHGLERRVEMIEEYAARLQEEKDAVMAEIFTARKLIDLVPGGEKRMYLREYYICGHSYRRIASIVHASKSAVMAGVKAGEDAFNAVYEEKMKAERQNNYRGSEE